MTPAGLRPARRARSTDALGLSGAAQDAALARAQREHVARARDVVRAGVFGDRGQDRAGPVGGGDARRDPFARLDRDREGGTEAGRVLGVGNHHPEVETLELVLGHRQADEAATVHGHEVDGLGGDEFGRHAEVALVLAVLVVDQDDHLAGTDILEGFLDGTQHVAGSRADGERRGRHCGAVQGIGHGGVPFCRTDRSRGSAGGSARSWGRSERPRLYLRSTGVSNAPGQEPLSGRGVAWIATRSLSGSRSVSGDRGGGLQAQVDACAAHGSVVDPPVGSTGIASGVEPTPLGGALTTLARGAR